MTPLVSIQRPYQFQTTSHFPSDGFPKYFSSHLLQACFAFLNTWSTISHRSTTRFCSTHGIIAPSPKLHTIVTPATDFRSKAVFAMTAKPLPKTRGWLVEPTTTQPQLRSSSVAILDRRASTPGPVLPVPDPRPEESEYPTPQALVTTFCGWAPPVWAVGARRTVYRSPIGPLYITTTYLEILENIPVFVTSDPSWCPCIIRGNGQGGWSSCFAVSSILGNK